MLDSEKIGRQITLLRKEKGFTGEKLAELLDVSPQAISKWENGKCLPETALLPELAKALDCSIDTLLVPKELIILEAIYTDGNTSVNVTQTVNNYVCDNRLNICVNGQYIGAVIESDRLKLMTVKYQIPSGTYYSFGLQNETLTIDLTGGQSNVIPYKLIGAYYGNMKDYTSAMQKMEHYEFFKWDSIGVNHETFPSNTASDDTEYLTLIYLNKSGIHAISCAEDDALYYCDNRTAFQLKDKSKCILPGIMRLEWERGMECPWAGSLYAALKFMGEDYTYEQIMGISGACYRICFVDVWDWSCTDALVSFDYATPLYKAIGYTPVWAERLEKGDRKAERTAIIRDLQNGVPVLAINLRVAPEWGVITGYLDNGDIFLCRTYFDKFIFDEWDKSEGSAIADKTLTFEERGGYLVNDFWPFLITHFGEKNEKPSPLETLMTSLETLVAAFNAGANRGYYQGRQGYEAWIKGLLDDNAFDLIGDKENTIRRMGVNDNMLFNLIDARRAAEKYLRENIPLLQGNKQAQLEEIANNYRDIHTTLAAFREKQKFNYDTGMAENPEGNAGVTTPELRQEQVAILQSIIKLEEDNVRIASGIIEK